MPRESGLCVVHLVRTGEPAESLRRFVSSYLTHEAGTEHRLAILYKGFDEAASEIAPYREILTEVAHTEAHVSDEGFDLTAYRACCELLPAARYCFLNSHSEILACGWLAKLAEALGRPGVGIAGATGSWASQASLTRYVFHLPGAYDGLFDRAKMGSVVRSLEQAEADKDESEVPPVAPSRTPAQRALRALESLPGTIRVMRGFGPFPVPHVRTNAFVIAGERLAGLTGFRPRSKFEAHRLESGHSSITRQLDAAGLRAVVVDRDGTSYEHQEWPASETFWQARQSGLLVADNQTRAYERGDADRRLFLSRYAWGDMASPA